jgi:predicted enzyme related to lactoylglutathione lyase
MSDHSVIHFELSSKDQDVMKAFYGSVFGWEFQDWPEMNYVTFTTGEGKLGGGFSPVSEDNPAGLVVNYVNCDDINSSITSIKENGGKLIMPVMEIPDVGQVAMFTDPSGNTVGLLQPAPGM